MYFCRVVRQGLCCKVDVSQRLRSSTKPADMDFLGGLAWWKGPVTVVGWPSGVAWGCVVNVGRRLRHRLVLGEYGAVDPLLSRVE